ncbi:MAG: phosphodiester glycosidase family protein [Actinomycetales bacterium]|nr:phosphodiester glycosidase family protein [Actinomycetales bacterium]
MSDGPDAPRRWWHRRRPRWAVAVAGIVLVLVPVVAGAVAYLGYGWFGVNVLLTHGGYVWDDVTPEDRRLSTGMRLALHGRTTPDPPAEVRWRSVGVGLEVAELDVHVAGQRVDTLLLTRVDPAHHGFRVLSRPAGDRDVGEWLAATDAVLVVNGSYFTPRGAPATPLVSDGRTLGPTAYRADHGAFVVSAAGARLEDLTGRDWRQVLAGADQAMVSYPLLLGEDGRGRTAAADPRWLANRSFVGQDGAGRIVVGTTRDAYFSLPGLAAFLPRAGLDLRLAMNLDGGPIACQAVSAHGFHREFCGSRELAGRGDRLRLLRPLVGSRRAAGLPVVLVVTRR